VVSEVLEKLGDVLE